MWHEEAPVDFFNDFSFCWQTSYVGESLASSLVMLGILPIIFLIAFITAFENGRGGRLPPTYDRLHKVSKKILTRGSELPATTRETLTSPCDDLWERTLTLDMLLGILIKVREA